MFGCVRHPNAPSDVLRMDHANVPPNRASEPPISLTDSVTNAPASDCNYARMQQHQNKDDLSMSTAAPRVFATFLLGVRFQNSICYAARLS